MRVAAEHDRACQRPNALDKSLVVGVGHLMGIRTATAPRRVHVRRINEVKGVLAIVFEQHALEVSMLDNYAAHPLRNDFETVEAILDFICA